VSKGIIADQFYAERLYNAQNLKQLFSTVGFTNVDFHKDYFTQSSRNQDLGMMAKRMLVSSQIIKERTPVPVIKDEICRVAVLLGDPRIKDLVKPNGQFDQDDFHTINELKKALKRLKNFHFRYYNNHKTFIADLVRDKKDIDLVFNLCDEGFHNEARKELHVPALLELLAMPYTGGNPQCLSYCFDKSLVRGIAKEMDIPVPEGFVIKPEDTVYIDLPIPFPVIVKPNYGDSSIGINQHSVCHNVKDLENAVLYAREAAGYDKPVLVEQYLTGKDVSVGILGNPPEQYNVLPVIMEDYSALPPDLPRICGYEAKWNSDSPYWKIKSIPAGLDEATERYLVACCLKLFERLECRDYARFDWRLDDNGTPRLLEVNPNPGWCWDGHLAKMAKMANIDYTQMLQEILIATSLRYGLNEKIKAPAKINMSVAEVH
jgi:D-alanine-D-alanine ligase